MTLTYVSNLEVLCSLEPTTDKPVSREVADGADDDDIRVVCTGESIGVTSRTFFMKRSALQRSAPLDDFFKSMHYRFGCGMTLYFSYLPASCFAIAKNYLEMGPDRYTAGAMIYDVRSEYSDTCDRLHTYVRLLRGARQLELHGLQSMIWAILNGKEGLVDLRCCVHLARMVFAHKAGFGHAIRTWLTKHIKGNFEALSANPVVSDDNLTWYEVVHTLCASFKKDWADMIKAQDTILYDITEDDDDRARNCDNLDCAKKGRSEQTITEGKEVTEGEEASLESTIDEVLSSYNRTREDDEISWEDVDKAQPSSESSKYSASCKSDDTKARQVLGVSSSENLIISKEASLRSMSLDIDSSKAMEVMGIDSLPVSGISPTKMIQSPTTGSSSPTVEPSAARYRSPTLTRAIKSFSNFKR